MGLHGITAKEKRRVLQNRRNIIEVEGRPKSEKIDQSAEEDNQEK